MALLAQTHSPVVRPQQVVGTGIVVLGQMLVLTSESVEVLEAYETFVDYKEVVKFKGQQFCPQQTKRGDHAFKLGSGCLSDQYLQRDWLMWGGTALGYLLPTNITSAHTMSNTPTL